MAALAPVEGHTLLWDRPTDPNPAWALPETGGHGNSQNGPKHYLKIESTAL